MRVFIGLSIVSFVYSSITLAEGPYMATGFKVGEVTDSSAVVWTRLTRAPERVPFGAPMPGVLYRNDETGELEELSGRPDREPVVRFPAGVTVDTIEGAAPGAEGQVRVKYRVAGYKTWETTRWRHVDPERDYTAQFKLGELEPGARYDLAVESRAARNDKVSRSLDGEFRTAPAEDAIRPVTFTVSTGQAYPDQDAPDGGFKIYDAMRKLDPNFFVHTGDIVYYDDLGKSAALARWHWQRTYSLPTNLEFHRHVSSYFIKDDHDTWMNDCWPGQKSRYMGYFTFEQGLEIFPEQVPMDGRTYRTFRWGKDLQIWLVEGRDFRSPNTMEDGPDKTIWGDRQKRWFKRTVQASDATFRVLISPTPVVGPDRTNKRDNHANRGFQHEGDEIRAFIAEQENMYVVCGDRHWQYVSVDPETGVREYSCGPASNEHAGGWDNSNVQPEHEYLNVTGGFLAVTVARENDTPTLTARHYSVDGELLNEDQVTAR